MGHLLEMSHQGHHWAVRTIRFCVLLQLLFCRPAPAVMAAEQPRLSVAAETPEPGAVLSEPATVAGTGIQVFETPQSSAVIQAADQRLRQQVKARLETDPWVLSYKIDVSVRQGMVKLEGLVDNLLAKERATQVTQTVPLVRRVNNHIHLTTPPRIDQRIHDEVQGYFLKSPPLKDSRVDIEVHGGFVLLSGRVSSEYRKQLAEALAASVQGVRGVENKLRVDHLTPRSDRDIKVDVESRIQWDPGLPDPQVVVVVHNAAVQLAGMVETSASMARAVQDARVAGVKAVEARGLAIWEQTPAAVGGATPAGGVVPGP